MDENGMKEYRIEIEGVIIGETLCWPEVWRNYREIDLRADGFLIGRPKMLFQGDELIAVDLVRKPLLLEEYAYRVGLLSVDEYKEYQDKVMRIQHRMASARSQEEYEGMNEEHKTIIEWVLWVTKKRHLEEVKGLNLLLGRPF